MPRQRGIFLCPPAVLLAIVSKRFFAFTACDLCGAFYIPMLASGHSQRNVLLDAVFFLPMSAGSAAAKASAAPTESSAASTRAS